MGLFRKKEKSQKEKLEEALAKLEKLNKKQEKVGRGLDQFNFDALDKIQKMNEEYERKRKEESKRELEQMMRASQELDHNFLSSMGKNR